MKFPNLKNKFLNLKESLESEIGFVLEQTDKDKSRGFVKSNKEEFLKWFDKGGYRSPESEWDQIQEEMIGNMIKLEKLLKPALDKFKSSDNYSVIKFENKKLSNSNKLQGVMVEPRGVKKLFL